MGPPSLGAKSFVVVKLRTLMGHPTQLPCHRPRWQSTRHHISFLHVSPHGVFLTLLSEALCRLAAMATCSPSATLLYGVSYSPAAGPAGNSGAQAISLPPKPSPLSKKRLCGATVRSYWGKPGPLHLDSLLVRATTTEETSTDVSKQVDEVVPTRVEISEEASTDASKEFVEVFSDFKEKWDSIENKSEIIIYGSGALVALWISSTVVTAINSVPLFPKVMELIGLGYSVWFTYRYLLFKKNREELAAAIEDLKQKISG